MKPAFLLTLICLLGSLAQAATTVTHSGNVVKVVLDQSDSEKLSAAIKNATGTSFASTDKAVQIECDQAACSLSVDGSIDNISMHIKQHDKVIEVRFSGRDAEKLYKRLQIKENHGWEVDKKSYHTSDNKLNLQCGLFFVSQGKFFECSLLVEA